MDKKLEDEISKMIMAFESFNIGQDWGNVLDNVKNE